MYTPRVMSAPCKEWPIVLSVVLPSYNSAALLERHVPTLIGCLESLKITYEIIVSDDGSKDNGRTRTAAHDLGCRYVGSSANKGKGAAVRRAMLAAQGKFRIFTDADIPFELDSIELFLWYLDFKEFHVVVGDRTLEESDYFAEVPLRRRMGSHLYSFVVGRYVAGGWFDTQCGLKGFRAEVAEDLFRVGRINGFAFDVELLYLALRRNYDIKRLPVRLRCQEGSSVRLLRHGIPMVLDLGAIRWHQLAGHYRPRGPVARSIQSCAGSSAAVGHEVRE